MKAVIKSEEMGQMKAYVPMELKRRARVEMAKRDMNFSEWCREALEKWLQEQTDSRIS